MSQAEARRQPSLQHVRRPSVPRQKVKKNLLVAKTLKQMSSTVLASAL